MPANNKTLRKSSRRRMIDRIDTTGKEQLIDLMLDLGKYETRAEARKAYDAMTAALNGWLLVWTRGLPQGIHAKVLLRNCFSINLCWYRGEPGMYPNYPKIWIQTCGQIRSNFKFIRAREYHKWLKSQPQKQE